MAEKSYVVKALAALVNAEGGFAQLLHRGAKLPSNADPVQLQHMLDNDIVEEGEPQGGLEPISSGDLTKEITRRPTKAEREAAAAEPARVEPTPLPPSGGGS